MRQGIIFSLIIISLSFLGINYISQNITTSGTPEVVLIKNGEEIYSTPFLLQKKQFIWYIQEENGKDLVLKDEEILNYYGFDITIDDLEDLDKIDYDKIIEKSGTNTEINMLVNKDGYVDVYEANCPDKLDVKMGTISDSSKVLTCVPHKLVIKIRGIEASGGVDA